jgi:DNA-binding CsgD family transcriptional regulator
MDEFTESPRSNLSPTDRLSERQKQCLELVAKGHTSKEIGRLLGLSPSTVDNHLNIALERLGVDNRIAAARLFIQENENVTGGLIALHSSSDFHGTTLRNSKMDGKRNADQRPLTSSLFAIPPLGGIKNELSQRRRYYHVVQIMLLALMAFSAVTITIAGIVHLFSK